MGLNPNNVRAAEAVTQFLWLVVEINHNQLFENAAQIAADM